MLTAINHIIIKLAQEGENLIGQKVVIQQDGAATLFYVQEREYFRSEICSIGQRVPLSDIYILYEGKVFEPQQEVFVQEKF